MIWYQVPVGIHGILFVSLLITTSLQSLFVMVAGDLSDRKRDRVYIRIHYGLLAVISASYAMELLLVIASVEGGIYHAMASRFRYLVLLFPLLLAYQLHAPNKLNSNLRPAWVSFFLPLLRLPQFDHLPMPLSFALATFVAFWLLLDCLNMLHTFTKRSRLQITRIGLPQIIGGIGHGVCVARGNGWILESNQAFKQLCVDMGMAKTEQVFQIEAAFTELERQGKLEISELGNGRSIQYGKRNCFYQCVSFVAGRKTYLQLTLSDRTRINSTALALKEKNDSLHKSIQSLEKALQRMEQEETAREREKLIRAAHDSWSQRLAVVGMTLDVRLRQKNEIYDSGELDRMSALLASSFAVEPMQDDSDVSELLDKLHGMYGRIGVKINISGQAGFHTTEQKALCAIIREALANAVRHAFARSVTVTLMACNHIAGVQIRNRCHENMSVLTEGRGLYDMKRRAQEAGGQLTYEISDYFVLQAVFPRN